MSGGQIQSHLRPGITCSILVNVLVVKATVAIVTCVCSDNVASDRLPTGYGRGYDTEVSHPKVLEAIAVSEHNFIKHLKHKTWWRIRRLHLMIAIGKERVNQKAMSERQGHHYSFGYLPDVSDRFFKRKVDQELLSKWAMWDGLKIQGFYFDQDYKLYLLDEFVMDFFASPEVATHFLRLDSCRQFTPTGVQMESIRMEKVHCTLTTTELFDRLKAKDSQIIRNSSQIIKCLPEYFLPDPELHDENFPLEIGDQLRKMIIQDIPPSPSCPDTFENLELKDLYTEDEKKEFLFRIFQHLVLGGSLCQYEDTLTNYIEMAKSLYKSLLSISKTPKVIHESGNPLKANQMPDSKPPDVCSISKENEYDISISSVVIKILSARNENYANANQLFFNNHINNFLYLIINPNARTVFTLYHHVI